MKIGFDAKRAFNNQTGLGNYSRFILGGFIKYLQNEPQVLAFTPKVRAGIFNDFPKSNVFIPISKKPFWRIWGIKKDLNLQKIDIFHGLSNELPLSLKKSKIKKVVTIHDLIFIKNPEFYTFIDQKIYTYKLNFALKYADKIVAISQQTKSDILAYCPSLDKKKIEVVYQNCAEQYYQPKDAKAVENVWQKFGLKNPFIISVGTLEPRKNQLQLIKAFELLSNATVDLVLVGRGKKYKAELENYIKTKNLTNIKILSEVSNDDLPFLYAGSLFSAYISSIEGFGIPIVEALASGVPVLAAKGTCLEEAGGEGGVYIDPKNCKEIADAMHKLIENGNLRTELTQKGQVHIAQFKQEKIIDQLNSIYQKMLN